MYCEETNEYYEPDLFDKNDIDELYRDDCRERARDMREVLK